MKKFLLVCALCMTFGLASDALGQGRNNVLVWLRENPEEYVALATTLRGRPALVARTPIEVEDAAAA